MKHRLRLLIATLAVIPMVSLNSIALVHAEDTTISTSPSEPTTSNTSSGQQGEATETKVLEDTQASDYKTKLQERLAKRKQELKTKLTKVQEERVKARCKAAQGIVSKVSANAKQAHTTRSEVYSNIIEKLTNLSTKLKDAGKDTTELDKQIAELQTMVDTFNNDMTTLRQAAADLSNMDCSSDPSSFKASLESTRTAREAVATDSKAIRTYITGTIKTTLTALKDSIGGGANNANGAQGGSQ